MHALDSAHSLGEQKNRKLKNTKELRRERKILTR